MRKKALGKGLEALLPDKIIPPALPVAEGSPFREVEISSIIPNRYQPRQVFDPEELKELCDSIRSKGVIEPILVCEGENGQYELIAGERRWRAAGLAGLTKIPVLIRQAEGSDRLELALVENLLRKDLNPMESALAYQKLLDEFHLSQEQIAQRVGKSRSSVTNILRLMNLSEEVQEDLLADKLSLGHAKAILSLSDKAAQVRLARQVVKQGFSVRQTERMAKRMQKGEVAPRAPRAVTPEAAEVQQQLSYRLGTKVSIEGGGGCGKIVIEYYTATDLERILETILV